MDWKGKGICLLLSLLAAALLTGAVLRGKETGEKIEETQEELAKEVFRFHVLANSDSTEDQELKMKVKDGVLAWLNEAIPQAENARESEAWAREHLGEIEEKAREILEENGSGYPVAAKVEWCRFPEKTYGDITFPEGNYRALRIEIGEAKGHNWWCVLYPGLCFLDTVHAVVPEEGKEELKENLDEEEYEMVTATDRFKIRWFFFGDQED